MLLKALESFLIPIQKRGTDFGRAMQWALAAENERKPQPRYVG